MKKILSVAPASLFLTSLILFSTNAFAGEWIADVGTGCKVWNSNPSPGESIKWSGPCSHDLASGKGTLQWYINGRLNGRDEGDFIDGKQTGKVASINPNGNRFEANFVDGNQVGKGVLTYANGDRYEGDFVDGIQTGHGVKTYANGDRYEGNFTGGNITGKGVYVWHNGDRYEGDFVDGKMEGYGELTFKIGQINHGIWGANTLKRSCASSEACKLEDAQLNIKPANELAQRRLDPRAVLVQSEVEKDLQQSRLAAQQEAPWQALLAKSKVYKDLQQSRLAAQQEAAKTYQQMDSIDFKIDADSLTGKKVMLQGVFSGGDTDGFDLRGPGMELICRVDISKMSRDKRRELIDMFNIWRVDFKHITVWGAVSKNKWGSALTGIYKTSIINLQGWYMVD